MSAKGKALRVGVVLSLVLHITLGWGWTVIAAAVAGYLAHRGGWWIGGLSLLIGWGSLLLFYGLVDAYSVGATMQVMGGILGGIPSVVVIVLPLVIATLFGALAGGAGGAIAVIRHGEQPVRRFRHSFLGSRATSNVFGSEKRGKYVQ